VRLLLPSLPPPVRPAWGALGLKTWRVVRPDRPIGPWEWLGTRPSRRRRRRLPVVHTSDGPVTSTTFGTVDPDDRTRKCEPIGGKWCPASNCDFRDGGLYILGDLLIGCSSEVSLRGSLAMQPGLNRILSRSNHCDVGRQTENLHTPAPLD